MKILLIYPPFCSPSSMPHSISYIKSYLSQSFDIKIKCLDLNAKFNKSRFKEIYSQKYSSEVLTEFDKISRPVYAHNNKLVIQKKSPELFEEMLTLIKKESPDLVAFSLVYNSQCFYTQALIEELKRLNIPTLIGGPAVNHNIYNLSTFLVDEHQFAEYLEKNFNLTRTIPKEVIPDFSDYNPNDYLTKEIVIPLRTSHSCYYKQCSFCTHHQSQNYREVPLELIKKTIIKSGYKNVSFFDDMISKKRLLELAEILKPLKVKWWCQLRPSKELLGSFKILYDSGLRSISWGVESGNQRILDLMRKKTTVEQGKKAVEIVKKHGLEIHASLMLGNVGETVQTIKETINFAKSLDLVNATFFITSPFPGTDLYQIAQKLDHIDQNTPWEAFAPLTNQKPILVQNNLTGEDLIYWQKKAFRQFYLRPRYIYKKLRQIRGVEGRKFLFRGVKILLEILFKK